MFGRSHDLGANRALERRRQQEDYRANLQQQIATSNKLNAICVWDQGLEKSKQRSQVKQYMQRVKEDESQILQARRSRLAKLLARDEEQYRLEIAALQETPQQRAERLQARAIALKQTKEEKRKEVAEKCYEQQWKERSDELRTIESQRKLQVTVKERNEQVQLQTVTKQNLESEEARWAKLWEEDRLQKEKRAEADKQKAEMMLHKTRDNLNSQMKDIRAMQEQQRKDKEAAMLAAKRQLEVDAVNAKREDEEKFATQRKRYQEIVEFNRTIEARRAVDEAREAAENMAVAQSNLDAHREETVRLQQEKARLRMEADAYREYMAQRKAEELAMEKELDRLVQEEMERAHRERDAQREKEEQARQSLMREVQHERYQQLIGKEEQRIRELSAKQRERSVVDDDVRRHEEEERALLDVKKKQEYERVSALNQQVAEMRVTKQTDRDTEKQYVNSMLQMQQREMEKIEQMKQEAAAAAVPTHYRRKKVEWYS